MTRSLASVSYLMGVGMTKKQARLIIEAHEIYLDDEEEVSLLEENNPELLEAYRALLVFASSEA